jgi:DnaK suppressor protein
MQKRSALVRLRKTLLTRWRDLHEKLADELASLCDFNAADYTGDSADVAFETSSDEMSSQLAELDAREMRKIERALVRLNQGTYGICEGASENCQKRIPVSRLNALPYTTFCINCEREIEKHPYQRTHFQRSYVMNWDQIAGNWKQFKGNVKEKWGKLTDDDLTTIAGKREQLAGLLQQRYGYGKDQVEKELHEFSNALKL